MRCLPFHPDPDTKEFPTPPDDTTPAPQLAAPAPGRPGHARFWGAISEASNPRTGSSRSGYFDYDQRNRPAAV